MDRSTVGPWTGEFSACKICIRSHRCVRRRKEFLLRRERGDTRGETITLSKAILCVNFWSKNCVLIVGRAFHCFSPPMRNGLRVRNRDRSIVLKWNSKFDESNVMRIFASFVREAEWTPKIEFLMKRESVSRWRRSASDDTAAHTSNEVAPKS